MRGIEIEARDAAGRRPFTSIGRRLNVPFFSPDAVRCGTACVWLIINRWREPLPRRYVVGRVKPVPAPQARPRDPRADPFRPGGHMLDGEPTPRGTSGQHSGRHAPLQLHRSFRPEVLVEYTTG